MRVRVRVRARARVAGCARRTCPTSCRAMRAALASTRFLASRGISCMANMMVTTSFENGSPYVSALPVTKVQSEWTNLAMPSMQSLVSTPVAPAGVL